MTLQVVDSSHTKEEKDVYLKNEREGKKRKGEKEMEKIYNF